MPDFPHRSLDAAGKLVSGSVSAASVSAAAESLISQGLTPVDIAEGKADLWMRLNAPVSFLGKPKKRDVYAFTRDLARLTKAGLPLERALVLNADMSDNKAFTDLIADIHKQVRKGDSLAMALSNHAEHFQPYYVAAVHAGEIAGQLPAALAQLEEAIGRQLDFVERVRSSLIYPAILLMMVCVTLVLVITVVLPQFAPLFEGVENQLPWITRAVMGIAEFARNAGPYLLLVVVVAMVVLLKQSTNDRLRNRIGRMVVRTGWGQKLFVPTDVIRAVRTLGGAVRGGVQLDLALPMVAETAQNPIVRSDLATLAAAVRKGASLSEKLAEISWTSQSLLQMVRVGEETGKLGEMLQEAAKLMEDSYRVTLERFLGLLSPVLTLIMGCIVATLISAVLIGMMSVSDIAF